MGALWNMIDAHMKRMDFPPSKRRLALRLGVAPTTLKNWQRGFVELPKRENLEAIADLIGKPYGDVLAAALSDTGYARGSGMKGPLYAIKKVGDQLVVEMPDGDPLLVPLSDVDDSMAPAADDLSPTGDLPAGESSDSE